MRFETAAPVVARLSDPAATDPVVAGQKAATLARLAAEGFPVPPGVVLTTRACRRILEAAGLGADASPEEAAAAPLPEDVWTELADAVASLGETAFAVRSSGVAEDLAGASYAGQYETVLGVRGADELPGAVGRCLASAFSARLAAYRGAAAGEGSAPMAILVQRLVPAEAAGAAFTANPVTGDPEILVSAVRGLGERLVGGEAIPDEWVVRGDAAESLAAPEGAIDTEMARRVAELAARVEASLGAPQDVEWAMAGGELFLLQARPITALPQPPELDVPTEGFWLKDDAHYPAPLTPFGASVYLPALVHGVQAMCDEFGLLMEGMEQRCLSGEVYMRPVPVGGKERPAPPWWVLWLAARLVPSLRRRARVAEEALRSRLPERLLERWDMEWREGLRREAESLRGRELRALDDQALLAHLDDALDLLRRGEVVHFRLWVPYMLAVYELGAACRDLLGWDASQALALLGGTSEASSAPSRALGALAAAAAPSPGAREAIAEGGPKILDRLRTAAPDLAQAFASCLEDHGHRTTAYDPGAPTLAERPELLAALVLDRMREGGDACGRVKALREDALARARAVLASRPAAYRERFERALASAQRAYGVREENVFVTDLAPNAVVRYTLREIGGRLAERGMISEADDAVWLEDGELRSALRGDGGDLRPLVARRRAERAWVAAHPGPASYGKDPGVPPDVRGLPGALGHITAAMMWHMELVQPVSVTAVGDAVAGVAGSPGRHTGPVRVIRDESEFHRLRPGDVLVCPITSPTWSVLFSQAGALVTDGGGVLAHAAVIAREHGIPAVLATRDATRRLRDGELVTVDGTAGVVLLEPATVVGS